jgi:hypothetical protein
MSHCANIDYFIYLLIIWWTFGLFQVLVITSSAILNMHIHILYGHLFVFLLSICLIYTIYIRSIIDDSCVDFFKILKNWKTIFQSVYSIYHHTISVWIWKNVCILEGHYYVFICSLLWSYPSGCEIRYHHVFDVIFLWPIMHRCLSYLLCRNLYSDLLLILILGYFSFYY